jgi:hypothetical protein
MSNETTLLVDEYSKSNDVSLRGDRSIRHTLMHWFPNEGTFTLAPEFKELVALLETGATWRAS